MDEPIREVHQWDPRIFSGVAGLSWSFFRCGTRCCVRGLVNFLEVSGLGSYKADQNVVRWEAAFCAWSLSGCNGTGVCPNHHAYLSCNEPSPVAESVVAYNKLNASTHESKHKRTGVCVYIYICIYSLYLFPFLSLSLYIYSRIL